MNSIKTDSFLSKIVFRRAINPNRATAIVFILAATIAVIIIWRSEQNRIQLERARISDIAGDHAHAIQTNIERALSATYSLAAMVREGKGNIHDFEATASEMLPFYPGASSLQLAPSGIVQRIIPLAGNKEAIGHNLLKDPARTKEAFLARNTGKLTLAGPFNLLQGGVGAVGRLPVFLENRKGHTSFWGFTCVLILFPEVLTSAHLSNLEKRGLQYELWRIHPDTKKRQVIAASSSALPLNPVDRSLELPNGTWTLSMAPSSGWADFPGLLFKISLGLTLSLLLSFLTLSLLKTRVEALRIAEKLTADLRENTSFLNTLLDSLPLPVFYKDTELRYIGINKAYEDFIGKTRDQLIGKNIFDIVPLELAETYNAMDLELLRDKCTQAYRSQIKDMNGVIHYVIIHKATFTNSDGHIHGLIGAILDITELYQAQSDLYLQAVSLKKEIEERRRVQNELEKLNETLEQQVLERTAELNRRNTELSIEIHEREQAEEGLRNAKEELEKYNRLLKTLSVTDSLSGLANRRLFDKTLNKEHARHSRSGAELSMIMIDIDHFKAFNDSYGHVSGDDCLQQIAQVIANCVVRAPDLAARYGGEEFACILPETGLAGAVAIAEKIRRDIMNLAIPHTSSATANCVTASLGVVTITCTTDKPASDIVILADKMLYKAKHNGRNRVEADAPNAKESEPKGRGLIPPDLHT